MNHSRTRKVGYLARNDARNRRTRFLPALELAGNWFEAAGFAVGQQVVIQVGEGVLTIRPAC